MKITKKLLFIVLACLLVLSPICLASNEPVTTSNNPVATNNDKNDDKVANQNSSIKIMNTDLYVGEENVVIDNAINGNVFAMGSNVTIKGEIVGDLFVCANTLTIEDSAVIYSNVFAMANTFVMKGNAYDIYACCKKFDLTSSGYIYRDIKLYAETANFSGIVKKDVFITADNITMPENAKSLIGGNLNYSSNKQFTFPEGAVVGETKYTPYQEHTASTSEIISSYVTNFIMTIIYAIIIILLATFFAPKFIEKANYVLMKKPFVSAGIGILSFVLVPVAAILLLMTGFFMYVSMAVIAVYALILSITLAIFSMAIGKSIVEKLKTPSKGKFILFSILSAIVLWVLEKVPYIGGYISLFILVVGLGVFLYSFFMRKDISSMQSNAK